MDLGIRGRRAIICASSRGLGRGCAEKLAEAGCIVTLNGRNEETLQRTADAIAERYGAEVKSVATDVTTEEGRAQLLEAEPAPDILVNNAGGPPPGLWSEWGPKEWHAAVEANMLTPIYLITAVLPGMMERKWGRIVNITSSSVKAPIGLLGLSNSARAGLTGFVAGTARQVAGSGVTINNLLPGTHDTDRIRALSAATAKREGISEEQARQDMMARIPAGRFGDPTDFGAFCAMLCSEAASFMVGQNVLVDGGAFNSTMG